MKKGAAAVMRRRLLQCTVLVPAVGLMVNSVATQIAASRLHYQPSLGPAVIGRFYWPWNWYLWEKQGWSSIDPSTFSLVHAILMGSMSVSVFALMAAARRKPKEHSDVHGTARYLTRKETVKAGLLPSAGHPSEGLYVGAWMGRGGKIDYLRHEGVEHLFCTAPMRSGKSHGICLPNLLTYRGSVVVHDPKGELWDMTAGWRSREGGNTVLRLELGGTANTARYNFFDDVRLGTEHEYLDMSSLMEAVADPAGKGMDGHFDPEAATLLIGVGLHVMYSKRAKGQSACLPDVLYALNNPDDLAGKLYQEMVQNRHLAGGKRHDGIARIGAGMMKKENKERSGVQSTGARMLRALNDPVLAENLSYSDFAMMDLMNHTKPVSLYVVVPESQRIPYLPLIRLFFTKMMDRLLSEPTNNGKSPHRWPLLLMMDEFAALKKMESFVSALERCPGYGIRAFLLVQDHEQLIRDYGQNETVTAMCHIRLAFTPNDIKTAKWITDSLGTITVNKEDVSESGSNGKLSSSRSYHQSSRNLLNPDEVMRLKTAEKEGTKIVAPGELLIFVAGQFPIKATQSLWFFDPELTRRIEFPKARSQTITHLPMKKSA